MKATNPNNLTNYQIEVLERKNRKAQEYLNANPEVKNFGLQFLRNQFNKARNKRRAAWKNHLKIGTVKTFTLYKEAREEQKRYNNLIQNF